MILSDEADTSTRVVFFNETPTLNTPTIMSIQYLTSTVEFGNIRLRVVRAIRVSHRYSRAQIENIYAILGRQDTTSPLLGA